MRQIKLEYRLHFKVQTNQRNSQMLWVDTIKQSIDWMASIRKWMKRKTTKEIISTKPED